MPRVFLPNVTAPVAIPSKRPISRKRKSPPPVVPAKRVALRATDLASMKPAVDGRADTGKDAEKVISNEAIKRILKLAGARRQSGDLVDKVRGDKHGIVHKIFRDYLDDIAEKVLFIMIGEKLTTILPRHVQQLGSILGEPVREDTSIVAIAPIQRRIMNRAEKGVRMNPVALRLIISMALDRTTRNLRSGVGLAAHEADRQTVSTRDIANAAILARDFP